MSTIATGDSKRMITVIFDLRQSFKNDCRFISTIEVLQNITILRQTLMPRLHWSHFSLMAIKEGFKKVTQLQPLKDWQRIEKANLRHAFNQLKGLLTYEVSEHYNNGVQSITLNTALQNAIKEYKVLKSGGSELYVVIVTLRWEGYVKDEIFEFCHSGMEEITYLEVIELIGRENRLTYTDRIHVYSLPIKGLDIAAEALFKSWLKDIPCRSVILLRSDGKDMEILTCAESPVIELKIRRANSGLAVGTDRNQVGDPSLPAQLTVEYFISKSSLCQTMEYGVCWLLTAKGTEAGNCYRFTALSRFLTDRNMAGIAKGVSPSGVCHRLALISSNHKQIITQPIVTEELSNYLAQSSQSSDEIEVVDDLASRLPVHHDYQLSSEIGLLHYLDQNCFAPIVQSVSLMEDARLNPTVEHAHPALGMY